jgi:hypothetical protein
MANIYDVGDKIRLSCAFTSGSTPTDPTAVTVKVKEPDGTITTGTVVKDDTGDYHYDWTIDQAGRHWYRFEGTGTVVAAAEADFWARESEF